MAKKHKHVKTRTPYKAVEQYEKKFKGNFAKELASTMKIYMGTVTKQLKVK